MNNWKQYELGEICTINYGKSLVAEKRKNGNIPVYSSAGITGYHDEPLIESEGIIIGRKGTIGKVYYSPTPFYCIDTAYYILPNDKYNLKFLYYGLKTIGLEELNEDSAVPGLNRETAYKQTFLLPDLTTQTQIAQILSSLDDKIDNLNRQNTTLEAMAETLFRKWFVEEAEDSWENGKLGEEFDFVMGSSPPGESYNEDFNGIPMYQGNADFGFRFPSNRIFTTDPKRFAEKFDTLISVRAPVGEQNMANEKCCIGRGVAAFRYKNDHTFYSYTYYKLKSLMTEIKQFNETGTVFGCISKTDFEKIDIIIPDKKVVVEFQSQINPIDKKIFNNQLQIRSLVQMRDALLPKLMNNEIKL